MAVTSCTVTNVATPTSTTTSNLLNVLLLSSLFGCGTLGANLNPLAAILAFTGQVPLTVSIPLVNSSPFATALPSAAAIPSSLFGNPFNTGFGACAAPFGSNALSSILLLSLLGGTNIFNTTSC